MDPWEQAPQEQLFHEQPKNWLQEWVNEYDEQPQRNTGPAPQITNFIKLPDNAFSRLERVPTVYRKNGRLYVREDNKLPLKYTNRKIQIDLKVYLESFGSDDDGQTIDGLPEIIEVNDHEKGIYALVEFYLDENGKIPRAQLLDAITGIFLKDEKFKYIESNHLIYKAHVFYRELKTTADSDDATSIYNQNKVIIKKEGNQKRNVRLLKFNGQYIVKEEGDDIYQYEVVQNVLKQPKKMNCRTFLWKKLGVEVTPEIEQLQTNQQIADWLIDNKPNVYIVGGHTRPFDKTFNYSVLFCSGHIYLSQMNKNIIKDQKTIAQKINSVKYQVVEVEELLKIKRNFIDNKIIPYTHETKLVMFEKQMYVTKHQEMIFKLNSFYYDKYKKSFNFMGLFDGEVSKSSYELVDYRFRAPTYNRGDVKWPVMHIDQSAAYFKAFCDLEFLSNIKRVNAEYIEIDLFTMKPQIDSYYQVDFELTGVQIVDCIIQSINTYSYQTIKLLRQICRYMKIKSVNGLLMYEYETQQAGTQEQYENIIKQMQKDYYEEALLHAGIINELGEPQEGFDYVYDKRKHIKTLGDLEWKMQRNKIFGIMYGEYEQTKIDFKDMTDDHTHVLYLFNKQTNTENTASNYKFIHCQMANRWLYRLLISYINQLEHIVGIATDSLYFDIKVDYMPEQFKEVEQKYIFVKSNFQRYQYRPQTDKTKILQSDAGQGKTRYCMKTANKENDVIICTNITEMSKYINAGFRNVFNYQYIQFTHMYKFMNQYDDIYVDEWCLCPQTFIYKLLTLPNKIVLAGDYEQNIQMCSNPENYENIMNYFGFEELESDGPTRNDVDKKKYKGKKNAVQLMINDIKNKTFGNTTYISSLKYMNYDFEDIFMNLNVDKNGVPDTLIIARTNKITFHINKLYQDYCLSHRHIDKCIIHKNKRVIQEPKIFFKRKKGTCIYLGAQGEIINDYYGIAKTMYGVQGQEAENVIVIDDGLATFSQMYVALTRVTRPVK